MKEPELDDYCQRIFAFLAVDEDSIRFNELYRALNKANFKISRPTLSAHLRHLQKHKVISQRKEGKQNISYFLNWQRLNYLKYHVEYKQAIEKRAKDKEAFNSFPIDEKTNYVTLILSLIEVTKLKFEILAYLEPQRKFEATLTFLFIKSYLEQFRMWLLQTFIDSKENAQLSLKRIDQIEKRIRDELFVSTKEAGH